MPGPVCRGGLQILAFAMAAAALPQDLGLSSALLISGLDTTTCPKPTAWCSHVGATNEFKQCGGVPGHFCSDIFGQSGFSPCKCKVGKVGPTKEVAGNCASWAATGEPSVQCEEDTSGSGSAPDATAAATGTATAAEERGQAGSDCWDACGKVPGKCFDEKKGKGFCGEPGVWLGSCCRFDAEGALQAPECVERGCAGFHCCVEDPQGSGSEAGAATVDAAPAPRKHCIKKIKGRYPKLSRWASEVKLNRLFMNAEPSSSLTEAGVTVHNFDRTEDEQELWRPCGDDGICPDEREWWENCLNCEPTRSWWSTSIINWAQHNAFADSGIILAPEHTTVLCSYPFDSGTMERGCKAAPDAQFGPEELKAMLNISMATTGVAPLGNMSGMYNEVLIDTANFTAQLPFSIAAFVFGLNGLNSAEYGGEEVATARYVKYLDQNCLNESDVPLLKADFSQITIKGLGHFQSQRSGHVFRDVSAGARQYLKDNPLKVSGQQPADPLGAATRAGGRAFREGVPSSVREFVPPAELQEVLVAHRAAQLRKGQSHSPVRLGEELPTYTPLPRPDGLTVGSLGEATVGNQPVEGPVRMVNYKTKTGMNTWYTDRKATRKDCEYICEQESNCLESSFDAMLASCALFGRATDKLSPDSR